MAFCSNCGKELSAGDKFCSECGTPVQNATASERKTVYDGEVHKCPNCGEVLESFVANCPACGYELRGAKNSDSVREFANKLEKIERSRTSKGSGLKKLRKNQSGINETDKEKISLIRNFVIPNTKEDLFEFMILASSNINMHRYSNLDSISESEKAVSDAWEAKFEQAYEKAKLSFGNSQEFTKMHNLYSKKSGEIRKNKSKRIYLWIGLIVVYIAIFGVLFGMGGATDRKIDKENARLEAIVEEVYAALEEEDYVLARAKAATLTFSGPNTTSADNASEKWDKTREELLAIIDAAEEGEPASMTVDEMADTELSGDESEEVSSLADSNESQSFESSKDDSVAIEVQANEYLDLSEFGWYISGDYLNCVVVIRNIDDEYAIEFPKFRVTAYGESGQVLGSDDQTLSVIYPEQDFACADLFFKIDEPPNRIVVTLLEPSDYYISSLNSLEHPSHEQMIGTNITVNSNSVTGEIYNPNGYAVESAMITIIFRDEEGKIIYGDYTFIEQIPADSTVPFDVDIYTDIDLSQDCDVMAYLW